MLANFSRHSVKRLTKIVSLVIVSVFSSIAAGTGLEADSSVRGGQYNSTSSVPTLPAKAKSESYLVAQAGVDNIAVELETANDAFSTLSAALKAVRLNNALAGRGPFTIFAPTDEAFANLPPGTVQSLLRPENRDKLIAILTYHVVPGKVESFEARSGSVTTLAGQPVRVQVSRNGSDIRINSAKVILADIPARNGVIHGINQVLLPPDL